MIFWKLRGLGKISIIRHIVKGIFSMVYWNGRTVTIKRGPLRNYKWVCHKDHQFWMPLGSYESETASWLEKQIHEGMTFIDIGAIAGYFVLLGSSCVGNNGLTLAFESVPVNHSTINAHLEVNAISNVKLEGMVISDTNGEVEFTIEDNNANSHISDIDISHAISSVREVLKVKSIRLDDYLDKNNLRADVMKIDTEGAEVSVLKGATATLKKDKPICIVSVHSQECRDGCIDILQDCGYRIEKLEGFEQELCCFPN